MIEVPFVFDETGYGCAQAATAGVLMHAGVREVPRFETLRTLSNAHGDAKTFSADLVSLLHNLGLSVEYCNFPTQEDAAAVAEPSAEVVARYEHVASLGIRTTTGLTPENYRHILNDGKPIIALLDFRKFWHIEGATYLGPDVQGHFMTVVGHEDDNFFVHNSGPYKAKSILAINATKLFDAITAAGTFRDAVVVHGRH